MALICTCQSLNSIVHSLLNQINGNTSIHDGVHWIVVMWISTTHLVFLYANLDCSNNHLDDGWVIAEDMHLICWYYPKIITQQINGCKDELVDGQSDWSGSPPGCDFEELLCLQWSSWFGQMDWHVSIWCVYPICMSAGPPYFVQVGCD